MLQAVLFDLDATLLPMDQDGFVNAYFGMLAQKMSVYGYEPREFLSVIATGSKAMVLNNGEATNEQVFWDVFCSHFGEDARKDEPILNKFYEEDFPQLQKICGFDPRAAQLIHQLQDANIPVVLATNPLFPAIATRQRITWAGLKPEDFLFYTTYENSCYSKPNPDYYRQILAKLDFTPEHCLMVGNDVQEDMIARTLGMKVFLLTDCLINRQNQDLSSYPRGSYPELNSYIETLRTAH